MPVTLRLFTTLPSMEFSVRWNLSTVPFVDGLYGVVRSRWISIHWSSSVNKLLWDSGPRSERICLGAPKRENTFVIRALATTGAVWFEIGIASAHLEKWSTRVKMY